MSFNPVFGRRSIVASSRRSPSYFLSISRFTTACPSSSSTGPIAPIRTPATRTNWPWPGVTACAVGSSTFIWIGFSSTIGKRSRWLARM
jgi:hypothetical protein